MDFAMNDTRTPSIPGSMRSMLSHNHSNSAVASSYRPSFTISSAALRRSPISSLTAAYYGFGEAAGPIFCGQNPSRPSIAGMRTRPTRVVVTVMLAACVSSGGSHDAGTGGTGGSGGAGGTTSGAGGSSGAGGGAGQGGLGGVPTGAGGTTAGAGGSSGAGG